MKNRVAVVQDVCINVWMRLSRERNFSVVKMRKIRDEDLSYCVRG